MREYDDSHSTMCFHNYYADVEYNRMWNGDLKQYENSKRIPTYMVSDLLIQSRGYERNYLAVEMKRKGNNRHFDEDKDRERLASMVSPRPKNEEQRCVHNTLVGAFIVYGKDGVKIELFENVNGEVKKSDIRSINYKELRTSSERVAVSY